MTPTQAYIVHNGLLSALPEPQGWQRVGKLEVVLKRVLDPGGEEEATDEEEQAELLPLPPVALPSLPLGSGPDVEVDLLYRRMEPGDLLVVVSSSLARQMWPAGARMALRVMTTRRPTPRSGQAQRQSRAIHCTPRRFCSATRSRSHPTRRKLTWNWRA